MTVQIGNERSPKQYE